jgi:hypothetical protein
MPTSPLTDKQQAFIENYCNNGYNAAKAYKDAYPNCKGNYNKLGAENKAKQGINEAIEAYKAQITTKCDHNRQIAIDLLNEALGMARVKGDNQGIVSATRELNAISNLHNQTITTVKEVDTVPEADKAALQQVAADYKLKLA